MADRPLSIDALRCAVSQTRQLTAHAARLADALADHARSDLDPADDDLRHLTTRDGSRRDGHTRAGTTPAASEPTRDGAGSASTR